MLYQRLTAAPLLGTFVLVALLSHPAPAQCTTQRISGAGGPSPTVADYGAGLCLCGDLLFVGVPIDDLPTPPNESVYIYSSSGGAWGYTDRLQPSDGGIFQTKRFGECISASGTAVAVGAHEDPNSGGRGSVYVFRKTGAAWVEEAKIVESATGINEFGYSVSLDNNTLAVGAKFDTSGPGTGAVYIYTHSGGSWTQQATLHPTNPDIADFFGDSVRLSGDLLVASAPGDDDGATGAGAVYVFKRTAGVWAETAKLVASDASFGLAFGGSVAGRGVALSEELLIVGALGDSVNGSNSGSTYVYRRSGTMWTEEAKIVPSDGATGALFGAAVAVSGNRVIVGAPNADGGAPQSGKAYVYTPSGVTWTEHSILTEATAQTGDDYGAAVDMLDELAVVAAPREMLDGPAYDGAAFIYELAPGVPFCFGDGTQSLPCPCGNAGNPGQGCIVLLTKLFPRVMQSRVGRLGYVW